MALKAKRPSHQPFKLATSGFESRQRHYGRVAQLEERRLDTPEAAGSSPAAITNWELTGRFGGEHLVGMSVPPTRKLCFTVDNEQYSKIVRARELYELTMSDFFRELMAAFFEKRAPQFKVPGKSEPRSDETPPRGGGVHSF